MQQPLWVDDMPHHSWIILLVAEVGKIYMYGACDRVMLQASLDGSWLFGCRYCICMRLFFSIHINCWIYIYIYIYDWAISRKEISHILLSYNQLITVLVSTLFLFLCSVTYQRIVFFSSKSTIDISEGKLYFSFSILVVDPYRKSRIRIHRT